MYPGEVDGFTLFSGGEGAGQGTAWGRAFSAGSDAEIPAWLWKRDGTEPGTGGNIKAVLTGIFHVFYLGGD